MFARVSPTDRINPRIDASFAQDRPLPERLFDLAAIESTAPNGTRLTAGYEGPTHYALAPQYAADPGHLNAAGSQLATAFLGLVSKAR